MVRRISWFLNFDADDELASVQLGRGYTPAQSVLARGPTLVPRLAGLVGPDDVVIAEPVAPDLATRIRDPSVAGSAGRAWCPTPRALRAFEAFGVVALNAPPVDVLRRVNHRAFCAELGQPLPSARYIRTVAELEVTLSERALGSQWLLKRPFGFAGRGRYRLESGRVDPAARRWIEASLANGEGVQVEPWVTRAGDFALHGFISRTGALTLGEATLQRCDERGAWIETLRTAPPDLGPTEQRALVDATSEAAHALTRAGYFGPFGVDAFRWVGDDGSLHFNPRSEINARYSMGWAVGMGAARPDLDDP